MVLLNHFFPNKYKIDGKEWTDKQLIQGFLKDAKDLLELVDNNGDKEKIAHELSDCFWSILVLAHKFNIDIEEAFLNNMDKLEERI